MSLRFQNNCDNIIWDEIPRLLQQVGMSYTTSDIHCKSFQNSYSVVFVFDEQTLIGFGRAISDGVRQAAIYDVAIDPTYQGKGIGRDIVKQLMASIPDCNFMLYASPGKELFYEKMSFKKMKTAMALFTDKDRMKNSDFFVQD